MGRPTRPASFGKRPCPALNSRAQLGAFVVSIRLPRSFLAFRKARSARYFSRRRFSADSRSITPFDNWS